MSSRRKKRGWSEKLIERSRALARRLEESYGGLKPARSTGVPTREGARRNPPPVRAARRITLPPSSGWLSRPGVANPPYEAVNAGEKNFSHSLSTPPEAGLLSLPSCSMRGRFLEAILSADRARAGRTGAPRNGRQPGG